MPARSALVVGFLLATGAVAQPPADPRPEVVADATLKDIHNRGAELYNGGDPAGCYRMYEGALRAVRPFLAKHPAVQADIDRELAEVAKADGVKGQAFRLHEVIEKVRADLKAAAAKPDPKPATQPDPAPATKVEPAPMPRAAVKVEAKPTGMGGTVRLTGQPLAGAAVTIVSLDLPRPRVFSATADAQGKYTLPDGVPAGRYAVLVTSPAGAKAAVPAKYATAGTSGIVVEVTGRAAVDLNLQ